MAIFGFIVAASEFVPWPRAAATGLEDGLLIGKQNSPNTMSGNMWGCSQSTEGLNTQVCVGPIPFSAFKQF